MRNRLSLVVALGAFALAPVVASAQSIDTSAVESAIAAGAAPVAAVAGAVLLILAGVKIWKLVRRAM